MKVLFFSAHSAVWEFVFPEALVASALQEGGHEVVYVNCGEALRSYCISMAARNIRFPDATSENRAAVCRLCNANKSLIRERFGFPSYDIAAFVSESDRAEIRRELSSVTRENFLSFTSDGIPVGRTSVYEVILHNKKRSFDFDGTEWNYYLRSLENSLVSLAAAKKILATEKPSSLVLYSTQYSVNHVWKLAAERLGIAVYIVQSGASIPEMQSRLALAKDHKESISYSWVGPRNWEVFKNVPVTRASAECVVRHFQRLFGGGGFVFSPPKKNTRVREHFGIDSELKLLTATMSSFDESFAAEAIGYSEFPSEMVFRSQNEWISRLIEHVRNRDDLFLLVRPHPREFPRKDGSKVLAESAKALRERLLELPKNVKVNWPEDGLSMYDIAEETDVVLNAFSSVGAELPLLGVPVVTYLKLDNGIPTDLNYVAATEEEYFRMIDLAVRDGWRPELIRTAFRWFSLIFYWQSLDFSGSFKNFDQGSRSPWTRLWLDPAWFVESVWEKVSGILSDAPKLGTQRHLLRACRVPATLSGEINRMFSLGIDSLPRLRSEQALSGSQEQEEIWLKKGIGSIVRSMARAERKDSALVRRLREYAGGMSF